MTFGFPPAVSRAAYSVHERAVGRRTFRYLNALERSQWQTRDEIEQLQARKLAQLLRIAHEHSPWHAQRLRAAGLVDSIRDDHVSLEKLRRLPTMTKHDARENVASIRWHDVPGGAFKYNTGGSSGEPLTFWFGRWRQASDAAGRIRARRWWGVQTGERECYLWGAPVELSKTDWIKTVRDRLINQLLLNAFEMSPERMDSYIEALASFQPRCIYGYASSIALLAAHADGRGMRLRLPSLKVVCTTGEPLYPHQRELIARVFGSPVANEFGSRDIGFTAHESPHGQMLLMSESIILEVLDASGDPVPEGHMGEAVLTALHSEAQPFLRYRTGDMVRMSTDKCSAGRGLHVIDEVIGRSTDFIARADGTLMHALAVIYILRATPGVAEFRLVQRSLRDIHVLIVADGAWTLTSHHNIVQGLQARLGADVRVAIEVVDGIPAARSGKHRYVQSEVLLEEHLRQAAPTEYV